MCIMGYCIVYNYLKISTIPCIVRFELRKCVYIPFALHLNVLVRIDIDPPRKLMHP